MFKGCIAGIMDQMQIFNANMERSAPDLEKKRGWINLDIMPTSLFYIFKNHGLIMNSLLIPNNIFSDL